MHSVCAWKKGGILKESKWDRMLDGQQTRTSGSKSRLYIYLSFDEVIALLWKLNTLLVAFSSFFTYNRCEFLWILKIPSHAKDPLLTCPCPPRIVLIVLISFENSAWLIPVNRYLMRRIYQFLQVLWPRTNKNLSLSLRIYRPSFSTILLTKGLIFTYKRMLDFQIMQETIDDMTRIGN